MLFTYDSTANADNWLHEWIIGLLQSEFSKINNGVAQAKWTAMMPPARKAQFKGRRSVRNNIFAFLNDYTALSPEDRAAVQTAVTDENRLGELFKNEIDCPRYRDLPASIRTSAKTLFTDLFRLLTDFGLRDSQFSRIHSSLKDRVCAFCGCEAIYPPAPELNRPDLDHYLARSIYPFAASNLNNLAPMGDECNTGYKLSQDMLRNNLGERRKCSDPFLGPIASISLLESVPFARNNGQLPRWVISIGGDCEELRTWEAVFNIRSRYAVGILDPEYRGWLNEFGRFCGSPLTVDLGDDSIRRLVDQYLAFSVSEGFSDRAFLRRATFEMLREKCDDPNIGADVIAHLREVASLHFSGT